MLPQLILYLVSGILTTIFPGHIKGRPNVTMMKMEIIMASKV
jgi:hypothetical protein